MLQIEEWFRRPQRKTERKAAPVTRPGAVHRTEEHVKLYQRGDAISKSKLWGPLQMREAVSSTNKMQKKKREMDSYRIKTTSAIHQPVSASCITQALFIYGIGNFKMLFKFS